MKALIVDQFSGPSGYELQQHPINFDALCQRVLSAPRASYATCPASLEEVPEDYRPRFCTTAIVADERGMARAWRYNHDTSG